MKTRQQTAVSDGTGVISVSKAAQSPKKTIKKKPIIKISKTKNGPTTSKGSEASSSTQAPGKKAPSSQKKAKTPKMTKEESERVNRYYNRNRCF